MQSSAGESATATSPNVMGVKNEVRRSIKRIAKASKRAHSDFVAQHYRELFWVFVAAIVFIAICIVAAVVVNTTTIKDLDHMKSQLKTMGVTVT